MAGYMVWQTRFGGVGFGMAGPSAARFGLAGYMAWRYGARNGKAGWSRLRCGVAVRGMVRRGMLR
jgi:hypothetical protein